MRCLEQERETRTEDGGGDGGGDVVQTVVAGDTLRRRRSGGRYPSTATGTLVAAADAPADIGGRSVGASRTLRTCKFCVGI